MRPSTLKRIIINALKSNTPLMVHGSPGIGKSDIMDQARTEAGYGHLEDLRLSQLDQVDLRGVPNVENGFTKWNPPEFLVLPENAVLFADEINTANDGVLAAFYQIALNRQIGSHKLRDCTRIMAAGNLSTDHAMVKQMPSALKNRFQHVTLEVNLDDWCEWAIKHDIHESVIGFLRFRPALLNEFDVQYKNAEAKQKARNMREATAFATPRSWGVMSKYQHMGVESDIEYDTYCGVVGEGVAAEFSGYIKYYRSMPNIDHLLLNPKTATVPTEPATLYALSTGLAARATPDNFERVMQYTDRIPKEFQVLMVKDASMRDQNNTYTKAFTTWAVKNQDLLG